MQFISYKPFVKRDISHLQELGFTTEDLKIDIEFKNPVEHELIFVMDEPSGTCRYFLKCFGPNKVRMMTEHVSLGGYGIYGTFVLLYDLSKQNLEKWSRELRISFLKNKDFIRKNCEKYRKEHPERPKEYLDDDFIGYWND